ncbi:MAG: hypothetical protein ABR987_15865 [Terracidiphilus sp.]|jgi:uncharacterized Zn-binding protein involved in type VI secretion
MKINRLQIALHCVLLASAAAQVINGQTTPAQSAQDVGTLAVNVVYAHTTGTVRLNGIPLKRFGKDVPESNESGTLIIASGLSSFGINGVNSLTVDTKATGQDASTELLVFNTRSDSGDATDAMDHPLFKKELAGAGTIQYSLTLNNVPRHIFDDATPWKGDPNAVLAAVQALHKALVLRDMKTIAGFLRPVFESPESGQNPANFDAMIAHFGASLRQSKVVDLAPNLKVESYYDGRLFRVTDANGLAPIHAVSIKTAAGAHPDEMLEMGDLWCNRNGAWLPLQD